MSQNFDIARPVTRYTRADFTALRAYLNRLPAHQISSLYYTDDDLEALDCGSSTQLISRIEGLRDQLILRASDTNPNLADLLRNARSKHLWSPKLIEFLVQAADRDMSTPRRQDSVSAWLKPRLARVLREDGIRNLGDLVSFIEVRGSNWWKPIPLIGKGKAARIETWLNQQANTLGEIRLQSVSVVTGELVLLSSDSKSLAPIERIVLPESLDGHDGQNRNDRFCQISARNDYQAIEAYLTKFRHQEKTRRAYQKEIERFLLWCITIRKRALSSVFQDDCEIYKDFISDIPNSWIGPKYLRSESRWRPFAGQLSPSSQRYAIQAIRFFFNWLVNVRYLGGNPWATVGDPAVATPVYKLQLDKALPEALWAKLIDNNGILDQLCQVSDDAFKVRYKLRGASAKISMSGQYRLVRAILLLMGDSGLRREEVVSATRNKLRPISDHSAVWELDVLGKRNKWRTVFPSRRTIAAIQAHWMDRGSEFDFGIIDTPLFSPLVAPGTKTATSKHIGQDGKLLESGFSGDGLYRLIKTALGRIAGDASLDLSDEERHHLQRSSPHAFRHTFGTNTVAAEVALDVVQKVLGHASLQTTSIYVQAERKRSISELGKYFKDK